MAEGGVQEAYREGFGAGRDGTPRHHNPYGIPPCPGALGGTSHRYRQGACARCGRRQLTDRERQERQRLATWWRRGWDAAQGHPGGKRRAS